MSHGGTTTLAFLLVILLECGVGLLGGSRAAILEHRVDDRPVLHRRGLSSRRLVTEVAKTVITRSIGRNISLSDQAKLSLTRQCLVLELLTRHFDGERLTSHASAPRLSRGPSPMSMSMPFWSHPLHFSRQRRLSSGTIVSQEGRGSRRGRDVLVASAQILLVKFSRGQWAAGGCSRQGPPRYIAGFGVASSEPAGRRMR